MISVIVPAYNLENYIIRTLDSILAQTYSDIEVIVVNDGSTDKTGDILEAYQAAHSEKVRVIHVSNGGVTQARLTGVKAAHGEWIGFVDGDDEIDPDMYQRLYDNALKHGADISHCGYRMVFADGRVNYFYNTGKVLEQTRNQGICDLLEGRFIEPGLWNKLFRRELFENSNLEQIIDKSIKINEDLLMNYVLFTAANKMIYEDFCPYHYIVRQASASRSGKNIHKIFDPIKVKEWILNHSDAEIKECAAVAYLDTCINAYSGLSMQKDWQQEKKDIRKMILQKADEWKLLPKKRRLLAELIKWLPGCYGMIYRVYVKGFVKNPYE